MADLVWEAWEQGVIGDALALIAWRSMCHK